jgi:hypothetical protein
LDDLLLLLLLLEDDLGRRGGPTPFLDLLPDLDLPFLLFDDGANVTVGIPEGDSDGTCEGVRVLGFCEAGVAVGTLEPLLDDLDDHDHPFPPFPLPLLPPFPLLLLSPFPPFPFPLFPSSSHTSSRLWVFRCWPSTCPRTTVWIFLSEDADDDAAAAKPPRKDMKKKHIINRT